MKFIVGLGFADERLTNEIISRKDDIYEVYFSFGDFASGRNHLLEGRDYNPYEFYKLQEHILKKMSENNIKLNLLYNGNCYGKDSQSRAFFNKVGDTTDYIAENFNLNSITTSSLLIAKFIKANFKNIDVRASVNMSIGTCEGIDYVSDYFDSFYLKREHNRDLEHIKKIKQFADERGKKLFMLANSGCLNNCSAHTFHDNLVSHENEIAQMDNAYQFGGVCREYLKKEENIKNIISHTNFIRPEDITFYEPYFTAVKLATRVHKNPSLVLKSYVERKYSGNILDLLEPAHSIYPYIIENTKLPHLLGENLNCEDAFIKLEDVYVNK